MVVIWSQAVVSAIPWDLILINKPGKRFIAWVLGNCEKYLTLREHNNVPVISFRIVLWTLSFMIPCVVIFYASGQILRTALNKRVRVHVLEYPRNPVDAYSKSSFITIMITTVYFLCLIQPCIVYFERRQFRVVLLSSGSYHCQGGYEFQVGVLSSDFYRSQSEIFGSCSDVFKKEMHTCSANLCSHALSIAQLPTRCKACV